MREPVLKLCGGVEDRPYLLGDVPYCSRLYLLKNFRIGDPPLHDKVKFDFVINNRRVIIE